MNPDPALPEESTRRAAKRPLCAADNLAASGAGRDPGLTAVVIARQIDELLRALNYATRGPERRLEFAADVSEVLGSLHAALTKLPQACGQLTDFLARHDPAGALRAERGFPHAGRPDLAVEDATFKLGQAAAAANVTATALSRAQEAISGLSYVESDAAAAPRTRQKVSPQPPDPSAPDRGKAIER